MPEGEMPVPELADASQVAEASQVADASQVDDASEVSIRIRENGPLVITGPFMLVDHNRHPIECADGANVALCRCGLSERKPFCDGTHRDATFDGTLATE